jgi:hypothetical protein
MNLVRQMLWRLYQIALFFVGLFVFWNVMGEGESNYIYLKLFSSFAFAFFFGLYGTTLTVRAIDRFRHVTRDKSLDDFP